jgi:hypothetical protein
MIAVKPEERALLPKQSKSDVGAARRNKASIFATVAVQHGASESWRAVSGS